MKTVSRPQQDAALYTVAGVLVMTRPEQQAAVATALAALPGVELGAEDGAGRLAVTIEELPGQQLLGQTFDRMQRMPGVLAASLVYSRSEQAHSDDGRSADE